MIEQDHFPPYGEGSDDLPVDEDIITLSNGARIPRFAMEEYLASLDDGTEKKTFDKIDALVLGSVATMSTVALAVALRRLKKR